MIRVLVIIAVAGFFMATVCFGAVAALGGPAIARGDWSWATNLGMIEWADDDGPRVEGGGPEASRELAWTGDNRLSISVPAELSYTQGPEAKVTISGPKASIEHIIIDDGHIKFDRRMRNAGRMRIEMTAPSVTTFNLYGSGRLNIENYDQNSLDVMIAGSGDVKARGRANSAEVEINGSGDAELGDLDAERVRLEIRGSGDATIAPTESADIEIAGSGDVVLLTNPERVNTDIAGSGNVTRSARASERETAPAAPEAPAAPPAPAAPAKGAKI